MLKPQDIVVLLKLIVIGKQNWSYNQLAYELGMGSAEVHSACKRAVLADLAYKIDTKVVPKRGNLEKFIINGLPHVFYPEWGTVARGIPTSFGVEPLKSEIVTNDLVPIWPDPDGTVRGISLKPLYKAVPNAIKNDRVLYELMSLVDAIRSGQAREKKIAKEYLKGILNNG